MTRSVSAFRIPRDGHIEACRRQASACRLEAADTMILENRKRLETEADAWDEIVQRYAAYQPADLSAT